MEYWNLITLNTYPNEFWRDYPKSNLHNYYFWFEIKSFDIFLFFLTSLARNEFNIWRTFQISKVHVWRNKNFEFFEFWTFKNDELKSNFQFYCRLVRVVIGYGLRGLNDVHTITSRLIPISGWYSRSQGSLAKSTTRIHAHRFSTILQGREQHLAGIMRGYHDFAESRVISESIATRFSTVLLHREQELVEMLNVFQQFSCLSK